MSYVRDSWCCICTKRLDKIKKKTIRKIGPNSIDDYRRAFPNNGIDLNDSVCGCCMKRFYNIKKSFTNEIVNESEYENQIQSNTNDDEKVYRIENSESNELKNETLHAETEPIQPKNVSINSNKINLNSANCGKKILVKISFLFFK